jgi:mono/diheme cytochrome c family protein
MEEPDDASRAAALMERIVRRWPMIAGVSLVLMLGAFLAFVARPGRTPPGVAGGAHRPFATRAPTAAEGEVLWGQYCAACHGFPQPGQSPLGPVMVSREYLAWVSDERLDSLMTYGVPGTAMLGWGRAQGGILDERQVRSLLLHLRRLQPAARSDSGWRGAPSR